MNEQDIAIRLTGVKKRYKLGQIGGGTLTAELVQADGESYFAENPARP